jgi:hypothetical protein
VAKGAKNYTSSRGAIRLESTQIRWFSCWPGERLDSVNDGQRLSKGEMENNSMKPRDLTENRHSNSLKKRVNLLFLRVR